LEIVKTIKIYKNSLLKGVIEGGQLKAPFLIFVIIILRAGKKVKIAPKRCKRF
jgi:hypothetical protein